MGTFLGVFTVVVVLVVIAYVVREARRGGTQARELPGPTAGFSVPAPQKSAPVAQKPLVYDTSKAAPAPAPKSALPIIPAEAFPQFGDNILVARLGSPQLLLESAREVLNRLALDNEELEDLEDPFVQPLEGGGAAMVMPTGAGIEATLYVIDLLRAPMYGEPVDAQAWVVFREVDSFLAVDEKQSSEVVDLASQIISEKKYDIEPGQDEEVFRAIVAQQLGEIGILYGTRLYAYNIPEVEDDALTVGLTDQNGEAFGMHWASIDLPQIRPAQVASFAYLDPPQDVLEQLGLKVS